MIVPQFWAEGRAQFRERGRQVTVRRFGWSDTSEADARAMADGRAREALEAVLSGQKLPRREPKVTYNGAEGVPIREPILERRGGTILTRNRYGAQCLNTPDVMFVDIDPEPYRLPKTIALAGLVAGAAAVGIGTQSWLVFGAGVILAFFLASPVSRGVCRLLGIPTQPEERALRRIRRFFTARPELRALLYRTPAGFRLLFTHGRVDPNGPYTAEWFRELGADRQYAAMCRRQHCFRARVSPKPWRIGMDKHLRPHPGVWPVAPKWEPVRNQWIREYEALATGFASCRFMEALGDGAPHPETEPVRRWHDELSRAHSGLPIA